MTNPLNNLGRVQPSEDGAGWLCGLCPDPHDSYRSAIECRRSARKMLERDAAEEYQTQTHRRRAHRAARDVDEDPVPRPSRTRDRRRAVSGRRKSQLVGFVLTFFFGPLGLFYSSIAAALAVLIGMFLYAAVMPVLVIFLAPILWLVSIGLSFATVAAYNRRAELEDRRHEELVTATRGGR